MSDTCKLWLFLWSVLLLGVAAAAVVESYERPEEGQTDFMRGP